MRGWTSVLVVALAVLAALLAPVGLSGHAAAAAPVATPASVASPAASSAPAAAKCPTPQNLAAWTGSDFFDDVLVTFTVPGLQNMSAGNFQTVPCINTLPTYLPGFWMNISTDVAISEAYVTLWGTLWPTPNQPLADLPGFPYDTNQITQKPMTVAPGTPDEASFYFDTYRYFYPGSTVYFNVTVDTNQASPASINSADTLSQIAPQGTSLNATWKFSLNAPWWSPHFSDDVRLSTSPPVLGAGVFEPNINQSLDVGLESVGANGLPSVPVPDALLTFTIGNDPGFDGTYSIPFGPTNHTFQNLTTLIGPYPGAEIELNVSAWLPWEGGVIDKIVSPNYWYNWSTQGGWPTPELGLAANAALTSTPNVLSTTTTTLATGTSVNVTIHETEPNVTIDSSAVRFTFSDADGSVGGVVTMHPINQNTSYLVLPGLPEGGQLTFSLLAKDVFGDPLASGNYSYLETGAPTATPPSGSSYFFVEGINASSGALLANVPYTVANASWSQSALTTPFGFGLLIIPNGAGTLDLPYGTYTVTMTAFGHAQDAKVTLGSPDPTMVRFWFAHGAVSASSALPLDPITVGLIAGTVALTGAFYPLYRWFQERQRRAEQERTRVTL